MWFTTRIPRRKVGRTLADARQFVPRLEALEDRTVPSTLPVTNNLDSGAGSLRNTIKTAQSGDTIVFAPSLTGQTITLTSDQITISKSLNIEGPGAGLLAISGNDTFRVFDISGGLNVTRAGLTVTHGRINGGPGGGGGRILNEGSALTIANDVLSYNEALGDNSTNPASGGAIHNKGGSAFTATDSSFLGNQAIGGAAENGGGGGAIFDDLSTATFIRCTFNGNKAIGGNGGTTTKKDLGFGGGGAIWSQKQSLLTIEQSTFTSNLAIGGNGGSGTGNSGFVGLGSGGAILNSGNATLTVAASAFAYNQAIGGSNTSGTGDALGRTKRRNLHP
jgi:hypothetical protein